MNPGYNKVPLYISGPVVDTQSWWRLFAGNGPVTSYPAITPEVQCMRSAPSPYVLCPMPKNRRY